MVDRETHPLLQPRLLAAVGLLGIWGVGIGLMASRVVILAGFCLSLLSLLGIGALYWEQFRKSVIAIGKYSYTADANAIEIIIAFSGLLLAIPFSVYLYISQITTKDIGVPDARLEFTSFTFNQKDGLYIPRLNFVNKGQIASGPVFAGFAFLKAPSLSSDNIQKAIQGFSKMPPYPRRVRDTFQLQPGENEFFDLGIYSLTQQEYNDFYTGKLYIVALAKLRYADQRLNQPKHLATEICLIFTSNTNEWHKCSEFNQIIVENK